MLHAARRGPLLKPAVTLPTPPVAGVSAWYAADYIPALVDGDPIATWRDLSGNGKDLTASGADRPTFKTAIVGALPVVRFVSSFMDAAAVSLTQADTLIAAFIPRTIGGSNQNVVDGTTARQQMYYNSGGNLRFNAGADVGLLVVANNTVYLAHCIFNGASSSQKVNATTGAGNPGAQALTGLRVGKSQSGAAAYNGDLCELMLYPGALSAGDITTLRTYMARWGGTI